MASFPIQDRGFIAANDFRHVLLPQSQVQPSLPNCVSDSLNFLRISLVLRLFPLQADTTKEQRNLRRSLPPRV